MLRYISFSHMEWEQNRQPKNIHQKSRSPLTVSIGQITPHFCSRTFITFTLPPRFQKIHIASGLRYGWLTAAKATQMWTKNLHIGSASPPTKLIITFSPFLAASFSATHNNSRATMLANQIIQNLNSAHERGWKKRSIYRIHFILHFRSELLKSILNEAKLTVNSANDWAMKTFHWNPKKRILRSLVSRLEEHLLTSKSRRRLNSSADCNASDQILERGTVNAEGSSISREATTHWTLFLNFSHTQTLRLPTGSHHFFIRVRTGTVPRCCRYWSSLFWCTLLSLVFAASIAFIDPDAHQTT